MPVNLSVIIPTYSPRREFTDLLLDLVQQETRFTFEIIVVDDATPKSDAAFIGQCIQKARNVSGKTTVALVRLSTNSGPARARNVGVTHSSSENFLFIDADCFIPSKRVIEEALEVASEMPNMIIGGTVDGYGDGYIGFSDHYCHWITNLPGYDGFAPEPHLVSTNMLVSRKLWNLVGPFSEHLRSGEDVDLCFRATQLGIPLWLTDRIRIGHFDRTRITDYFLNYFFCGTYRPIFYGQYSKRRNYLTGGPRWLRILLIPLITAGLTLRYLYRWAPIDKRVFLAIGGIMLASFAMALGNALGPPKST